MQKLEIVFGHVDGQTDMEFVILIYVFELFSLLDKNDDVSASQRCQRGTPRKLSPSSVNKSNLIDGKRTRKPKQADPNFVYN